MARDNTSDNADDEGTPTTRDVPDSVRTGGTDPGHQHPDTPDQSPHDADKGPKARPGHARTDDAAGVDEEEAERVEREQSIGPEDRADPE